MQRLSKSQVKRIAAQQEEKLAGHTSGPSVLAEQLAQSPTPPTSSPTRTRLRLQTEFVERALAELVDLTGDTLVVRVGRSIFATAEVGKLPTMVGVSWRTGTHGSGGVISVLAPGALDALLADALRQVQHVPHDVHGMRRADAGGEGQGGAADGEAGVPAVRPDAEVPAPRKRRARLGEFGTDRIRDLAGRRDGHGAHAAPAPAIRDAGAPGGAGVDALLDPPARGRGRR